MVVATELQGAITLIRYGWLHAQSWRSILNTFPNRVLNPAPSAAAVAVRTLKMRMSTASR